MWNCDWEYENQEMPRQWYEEKSPVQDRIRLCGGSFAKGADGFFTRRSAPRNIAITICAGTVDTRKI